MVVAPLLLEGYDVAIPRTTAEPVPAQAEISQVILTLRPEGCNILTPPPGQGLPADCHVTLDGRDIPVADLPARLTEMLSGRASEQRILFIAADDRLNYEGVLRIVDLAKTGVDDLKIEFLTMD